MTRVYLPVQGIDYTWRTRLSRCGSLLPKRPFISSFHLPLSLVLLIDPLFVQNRYTWSDRAGVNAIPRKSRSYSRIQHFPPSRVQNRDVGRSARPQYHHRYNAIRDYHSEHEHVRADLPRHYFFQIIASDSAHRRTWISLPANITSNNAIYDSLPGSPYATVYGYLLSGASRTLHNCCCVVPRQFIKPECCGKQIIRGVQPCNTIPEQNQSTLF